MNSLKKTIFPRLKKKWVSLELLESRCNYRKLFHTRWWREGRLFLEQGHRGKGFTFPELLCCLFSALDTNEKLNGDKSGPVRLQSFNKTFTLRVKWIQQHDQWRDQFGRIKSGESSVFVSTTLCRVLTRCSTRMTRFSLTRLYQTCKKDYTLHTVFMKYI